METRENPALQPIYSNTFTWSVISPNPTHIHMNLCTSGKFSVIVENTLFQQIMALHTYLNINS